MTKPNRKRTHFVGLWFDDAEHGEIVARAEAANVGKSEMIRRMLAYAALKMPKGWKP